MCITWCWFGDPVRVEKHITFYKRAEGRILEEDRTIIRLKDVVTIRSESDPERWIEQIVELYEISPDATCEHTLPNEKHASVRWFYYKEHVPTHHWQYWDAKNCSDHVAKVQLLVSDHFEHEPNSLNYMPDLVKFVQTRSE